MGIPPRELLGSVLAEPRNACTFRSDHAHGCKPVRYSIYFYLNRLGWRTVHSGRERELRPRAPLPVAGPRAMGPGHRVLWRLGAACEHGGRRRRSLTGVGLVPGPARPGQSDLA